MVRRDDDRSPGSRRVRNLPSRCDDPAGASPVPVSAGAPGSRPAAEGETPTAEAGRRKRARRPEPRSTEQARGPQRDVKPAASTDEQSESRAGHFAAKATSSTRVPERGEDLGGVRGAARVQGPSRNTRDPSVQPWSRLGGGNRPKAKAVTTQRKSDGVIVPTKAVPHNTAGGKGHERGHVDEEGKRKGMTGRTGSNSPGRRRPSDNVRQLRRRLCAAAKRSPGRRFHALYDLHRAAARREPVRPSRRADEPRGRGRCRPCSVAAMDLSRHSGARLARRRLVSLGSSYDVGVV